MAIRAYGRDTTGSERRVSTRLPIERDVRYKVLGKRTGERESGSGKTFNMSGSGVLFTTESSLTQGDLIELTVSWPARLDNIVPLKLVALGRVVRSEKSQAAISIQRYEFRTCRSAGIGRDEPNSRVSASPGSPSERAAFSAPPSL
jgi:hypothetical protein